MNLIFSKHFWLFLFILNLILRISSLYTTFLDVDESQFAGFAHVLMEGGLPYQNSLDTKPLGIYLFYWVCFAIFGKYSMWGVHLVTILWVFASAYLLTKIFDLFDEKSLGRWAALFFVVFSTTFIPKYTSTSINAIMVLFLILSVWGMVKAHHSLLQNQKPYKWDVFSAFVLGIGFLFKYQAGIQTVMFFLFSLYQMYFVGAGPLGGRSDLRKIDGRTHGSAPTSLFLIKRNFLYAIFFLLPFVIHSLVLCHLGVWDDFYEWSILGSGRYISGGNETIHFWQNLVIRFGTYILATWLLWVLLVRIVVGAHGMRPKIIGRMPCAPTQNIFLFFSLWFILSLIPVMISGRFYAHYFLQLLPSLCALAALGLTELNWQKWKKAILVLLIVPAFLFWILRLDYQTYLKYFPDDHLYLQKEVGLKLKEISDSGDKIYVWGFATAIYFYSERESASRFLWSDWQTGRIPGPQTGRVKDNTSPVYVSDSAWRALWRDFDENPPMFFVDTSPANIHGYGDLPISKYPELAYYVEQHYYKIDQVEGVDVYKRAF